MCKYIIIISTVDFLINGYDDLLYSMSQIQDIIMPREVIN